MRRVRLAERKGGLEVGDLVWWLHDSLISFAYITEVRPCWREMDHPPDEEPWFTMYAIRKHHTHVGDGIVKSVHRSELYKVSTERDHLIEELESTEDRVRRYREELEDREPDYIPDPEKDDV